MSSRPKKSKNRRSRQPGNRLPYDNLEDRRVLASIVAFDAGTGTLSVTMSANDDRADIDIANGNIEVNGSEDIDSVLGGEQSVVFTALRNIQIVGDATASNQNVTFQGNYSSPTAQIQSITVTDVEMVSFRDQYDLAGDLSISLSGTGGSIVDDAGSRIKVGGETTITANDNTISLNNVANDFVGGVSASTTGTDRDIVFADANDLLFDAAVSTGDLIVVAVGDVSDSIGASVSADDGRFTAANVVLGDNTGDTTTFVRFESNTAGGVTVLNQDSVVTLLNMTADDLTVRTPFGIFDGRSTAISVANVATFESGARIRIGENGTDTFNAGMLNINATAHVHVWEDSGVMLTGDNTAGSLNLFSEGDISDDDTATLNVTNETGFQGTNIVIGDSANDQFNTGSMYFFTPGDFFVNEDSSIHIIESKNEANRMILRSPSSITDANDAQTTVALLSIFSANSVNLGDTGTDSFDSGSILFNTSARFKISENSSTNIVSFNTANNSIIESAGGITNIYESPTGNGTTLAIATVAEFAAANINLGEQTNDTMNFGAISVTSTGTVTISEDSATNFTFDSTAGELNLNSTAGVTDATDASLNVTGIASFQGTSIRLGDSGSDTFNADSITLNSTGIVEVTENSDMNLHNTSTAESMSLTSNGLLTDGSDAKTTVTNLLSLNATLITLGSSNADNTLSSGSLTFNSTFNTNISANTDIALVGISNVGDRLFLTSSGDISDDPTAETRVQNSIFLTGVNIELGELSDDCFDILSAGGSLTVTASGATNNVILGC